MGAMLLQHATASFEGTDDTCNILKCITEDETKPLVPLLEEVFADCFDEEAKAAASDENLPILVDFLIKCCDVVGRAASKLKVKAVQQKAEKFAETLRDKGAREFLLYRTVLSSTCGMMNAAQRGLAEAVDVSYNADQSVKKSSADAVAKALTKSMGFEDSFDKSMIKILSKFIAGKVMNKIAPNIFETLVSKASAALKSVQEATETASRAVNTGTNKLREIYASAVDSSPVQWLLGTNIPKRKSQLGLPKAVIQQLRREKELATVKNMSPADCQRLNTGNPLRHTKAELKRLKDLRKAAAGGDNRAESKPFSGLNTRRRLLVEEFRAANF